MKLKSRGLGRKELVMDFREYTVRRDGKEIVVEGTIREPVRWDFSIRMCEDDLPGIAKIGLKRQTIGLLIRGAFKRKKRSHWDVDRKTHLKDVREAIAARDEKAAEEKKKAEEEKAAEEKKKAEAEKAEAEKAETEKSNGADAKAEAETAEKSTNAESTEVGTAGAGAAVKATENGAGVLDSATEGSAR